MTQKKRTIADLSDKELISFAAEAAESLQDEDQAFARTYIPEQTTRAALRRGILVINELLRRFSKEAGR